MINLADEPHARVAVARLALPRLSKSTANVSQVTVISHIQQELLLGVDQPGLASTVEQARPCFAPRQQCTLPPKCLNFMGLGSRCTRCGGAKRGLAMSRTLERGESDPRLLQICMLCSAAVCVHPARHELAQNSEMERPNDTVSRLEQGFGAVQIDCSQAPLKHLFRAVAEGLLEAEPGTAPLAEQQQLPLLNPEASPDSVEVCITLTQRALAYEYGSRKSMAPAQRELVRFFDALDQPDDQEIEEFRVEDLYTCIKPTGDEASFDGTVPGLTATLRPFQVHTL